MSTPKHSVSVAGIVVDDDARILLIQRRDNGHWEPPGGVLELGESFEQGVRREVFEETGVSVVVGRLTGVYKNMNRGIVALVFMCQAAEGEGMSTSEARRVEWKSLAEARSIMTPAYFARVSDAFGSSAVVRIHDGVHLI